MRKAIIETIRNKRREIRDVQNKTHAPAVIKLGKDKMEFSRDERFAMIVFADWVLQTLTQKDIKEPTK